MTEADDIETLVRSLCTLLPYEHAAAASLGAPFDVETLAASSAHAAALDEAQIDLGEGPGWDAFRAHRPAQAALDEGGAAWPFFRAAPIISELRTVLALPLSYGPLHIGAVTLFSTRAVHAGDAQLRVAESVVALLARAVVTRALDDAQSGHAPRDAALSRREVHQATGMVISQTKTTPADALLLIRAYAFANSLSVKEVAGKILSRHLDLSPDPARGVDSDLDHDLDH